jgi:hypothetical protein
LLTLVEFQDWAFWADRAQNAREREDFSGAHDFNTDPTFYEPKTRRDWEPVAELVVVLSLYLKKHHHNRENEAELSAFPPPISKVLDL